MTGDSDAKPQFQPDPDFKDGESYEVFCPEGSDEPWHATVSMQDDGKFIHWAVIQMLQAKSWDADFEWAVFMKTGRCGSSGLRHFSKKFTDGTAALRTFAEWFAEKTGNKWLGDYSSTEEAFKPVDGKYCLLSPEVSRKVLYSKGERERVAPKLGTTDIPVDIYFKDRNQYQVYITPDQDLWTAVLSIKDGLKHSQYAILQVLVARPEVKVEFDFVVFMRQGKVGGSAQRYAKRYTVEAAALATFSQWFKEKTANEWYGSFKDSFEEFTPQTGKFQLLPKEKWTEVIEFEERSNAALCDTDVEVDVYYRDRDLYRVYHTENDELWAGVLSDRTKAGVFKSFVVLQLLAKKPDVTVDFDFVVFRRIGERGESGQWTAKKFTNELDALRTFKMWYQDESGNQWKGSFNKSFEVFAPVDKKLNLLDRQFWDSTTSDAAMAMNQTLAPAMEKDADGKHKISIDLLKAALAAEPGSQVIGCMSEGKGDTTQLLKIQGKKKAKDETAAAPAPEVSPRSPSPSPQKETQAVVEANTSPLKMSKKTSKRAPTDPVATKEDAAKAAPAVQQDAVDADFELKDDYDTVLHSAKMLSTGDARPKFYSLQLLSAEGTASVPEHERFCVFIRTGKLGTPGVTNYRIFGSRDTAHRCFAKKFQEKTQNTWDDAVKENFKAVDGYFKLVESL